MTVLEITNALSQVMASSHDGALDEKGKPVKIGLKREEGDPITDSRVIDGFGIQIHGHKLKITYRTPVTRKELNKAGFENECNQKISKIVSFLKKEYKKVSGKTLTLKKDGDFKTVIQSVSRVNSWATTSCYYSIGGISKDAEDEVAESRKSGIEKWYKNLESAVKKEKAPAHKDKFKHFDPFNMKPGQRNKDL